LHNHVPGKGRLESAARRQASSSPQGTQGRDGIAQRQPCPRERHLPEGNCMQNGAGRAGRFAPVQTNPLRGVGVLKRAPRIALSIGNIRRDVGASPRDLRRERRILCDCVSAPASLFRIVGERRQKTRFAQRGTGAGEFVALQSLGT